MAKTTLIITTADLKTQAAEASSALIEAVGAGNARASRFCYNAAEIIALARRAEQRLDAMGLTQVDRVGFEASFNHAGPAAKAYKYSASGRRVSMRRTAKGWALTSIDEVTVFPQQSERVSYRATEHQIAETLRRAVSDLTQIAA